MSSSDPRYAEVNARSYPPLTRAEAYLAARRILRRFGSPRDAAVRDIDTTGAPIEARRSDLDNIFHSWCPPRRGVQLGRTCWASTKPTSGHFKGWGRLIHDLSHIIHRYRHPNARPHGDSHHIIERDVAEFVHSHGLIADHSARSTAPRDVQAERAARLSAMHARLARWIAKRKRAETAISKLTRSIRAAERRQLKRHEHTILDSPAETGYMP